MATDDTLQVLLNACAKNDHAAFERLYELAAPRLFALCSSLLGRDDLAEEVLQETFVQIWRNARFFDRRRAAPMTWMSVIARRRAIDLLRKPRESATDSWEDRAVNSSDDDPLSQTLRWSENRALYHCLEQLPDTQRRAIALVFFRGLSHQELSVRLETPLGTVKSWVRRGVESLKRCLQR